MSEAKHSDNGLTSWQLWISGQIGSVQNKLGELHAQQVGNRQTVIEMYRSMTHRMDRIEDRMAKPNGSWIKLILHPKVVALILLSLLVASGHIKASELRQWVVEKILAF